MSNAARLVSGAASFNLGILAGSRSYHGHWRFARASAALYGLLPRVKLVTMQVLGGAYAVPCLKVWKSAVI